MNDSQADALLARHERSPYGIQHLLGEGRWQPAERQVAANFAGSQELSA